MLIGGRTAQPTGFSRDGGQIGQVRTSTERSGYACDDDHPTARIKRRLSHLGCEVGQHGIRHGIALFGAVDGDGDDGGVVAFTVGVADQ